jgi:ribosome-associated translation inhibitor RaiA
MEVLNMRVPLDISYQGLSRSEAIEELIRSDAAKLEKVCGNLISCRVGLGLDQKNSTSGNEYRLRIEMRVPSGHNLVVTNTPGGKEENSDLQGMIKRTFKTAHRRLWQQMEKQQGEKKSHPEQEVGAFVTKIFLITYKAQLLFQRVLTL